jgi:hypothetical protein
MQTQSNSRIMSTVGKAAALSKVPLLHYHGKTVLSLSIHSCFHVLEHCDAPSVTRQWPRHCLRQPLISPF